MPRSTDSGTPATKVRKKLTSSSAVTARTPARSSGATWVMVGAIQIKMAPTAAMSGRNSTQMSSAAPTARRCSASSSTAWRLETTSRSASVGRPSAALM